jgi:hypothetical protein
LETDEGLRVIDEALAGARPTGQVVWEPELLRLKGELRLAASPADVVGACCAPPRASLLRAPEVLEMGYGVTEERWVVMVRAPP